MKAETKRMVLSIKRQNFKMDSPTKPLIGIKWLYFEELYAMIL